jgi:hypothetical protein
MVPVFSDLVIRGAGFAIALQKRKLSRQIVRCFGSQIGVTASPCKTGTFISQPNLSSADQY